jgi:hypothetical protein
VARCGELFPFGHALDQTDYSKDKADKYVFFLQKKEKNSLSVLQQWSGNIKKPKFDFLLQILTAF